MTGAMAGSTALQFRTPRETLDVLTLTINNSCNLDCPHCYLRYDGPSQLIDRSVVELVAKAQFRHLAVVGKEPLLDAASAAVCEDLVGQCRAVNKSCSLITNGFGLRLLSAETLAALAWVDVSLDGGPTTYGSYRRGSYPKLVRLVRHAIEAGLTTVNGLFTLSSTTLPYLEDMMAVEAELPWNKLVFSPFSAVRSHGIQRVGVTPLRKMLGELAKCESFQASSRAVLLLGADAGASEGLEFQQVEELLRGLGLDRKTTHVSCDPLILGYLRVTYDGFVMTPYQSLHPAAYRESTRLLRDYPSLDQAYRFLRAS